LKAPSRPGINNKDRARPTETAAAHIGWQVSPFQFEVGMADLAIGITACLSLWRDLEFKTAAVSAASIVLLGDAIGHVRGHAGGP